MPLIDQWLAVAGIAIPTLAVAFSAWLNHHAQKDISQHITDVDRRAENRSDAHRQALEAIARDMSFMAGRQSQRDQHENTETSRAVLLALLKRSQEQEESSSKPDE